MKRPKCPRCGSKNTVGSTKEKWIEFKFGWAPLKCNKGEKEIYTEYQCLDCRRRFRH